MIQTIGFSQFCDAFSDTYKGNFTYQGKRALFDYLEEYEESTGEQVELDTIALCCEYSEYANAIEAYNEYNSIETLDQSAEDNGEAEALEWLQDRTQVIPFDGGVIIAQF